MQELDVKYGQDTLAEDCHHSLISSSFLFNHFKTLKFQPRILSWICFMVKTCNEPKRNESVHPKLYFCWTDFLGFRRDFFLQEVSPIKYVNTNGRTIKLNLNLEWRVFAVEAPNRALDFNTCQTFSQAITKQNAHAHNIQAQWPY